MSAAKVLDIINLWCVDSSNCLMFMFLSVLAVAYIMPLKSFNVEPLPSDSQSALQKIYFDCNDLQSNLSLLA
ncbi:hypothetical protein ACE6H2_006646 [Prunus campanulata]